MNRTYTLERGARLYHATDAKERYELEEDPEGPFWVSDDERVAQKFLAMKVGRGGGLPRILVYEAEDDAELLLWQSWSDMEAFFESEAEDAEYMTPPQMAEVVCDAGFDGWIVPANYPEGADIMLCDPALRLADVVVVEDPKRGFRGLDWPLER